MRTVISEDDERPRMGHLRNGNVLPVDERYFSVWVHQLELAMGLHVVETPKPLEELPE